MRREAAQTHARQDGQFGQVEDAIGIIEKDDDLVAIFLASGASANVPCPRHRAELYSK